MASKPIDQSESVWPRRVAMLVAITTFPLIWVGGLVTTYDAGMAVPDWPSTYGYNLFLYPWQTWFAGPFDLFVEHGHRLLGAVVGMLTITLVMVCWFGGSRVHTRWFAVLLLLGVILQGALGGARVVLAARTLALVHGCVGPVFFAAVVAFCVRASSPRSDSSTLGIPQHAPLSGTGRRLRRLALITTGLVYLQLVVGANLRHVSDDASPSFFRVLVVFHLLLAAAVVAHAVMLVPASRLAASGRLVASASMLLGLLLVQLLLGGATWVSKYSWPVWFERFSFAAGHVIEAKSLLPSAIITAHVATGSLILAASVVVALRGWELAA